MDIDRAKLESDILEASGNEELAGAVAEAAESVAEEFRGETGKEFFEAVKQKLEESEVSIAGGGGLPVFNKVRGILVDCLNGNLTHDHNKPPEEDASKAETTQPESVPDYPNYGEETSEGESVSEPEEDNKGDTPEEEIKVLLNGKVRAYGGGYYDHQQGWIKGKEAITVKRTTFVMKLIGGGELIEVK